MKIQCLAVDDEPLALELVSSYIKQTPFLELAGECSNAFEAMELIDKEEIELIFLDIQMPGLTGVEFTRTLEKSSQGRTPRVIFTTAFNHFALEGFRLDAIDYLLKPFNYEEFLRAANKAKHYFELLKSSSQTAVPNDEDSMFIKSEYQLVKVNFEDILYIEGLKDYVKIFVQSETRPLLSLITLKSLEEKLPAGRFMRVHRSYIVALNKIKAVGRQGITIGKEVIPVSTQYREDFDVYIKKLS
jgi:two-component system, LytTR family, response regulator LytT